MVMRLAGYGSLMGTGITLLLALADWLLYRKAFGLFTGLVGAVAGGLMLLLALGMAYISYLLASRGKGITLRRRLLASAIFTGAAGMLGGLLAIAIWLAAGRPVLH